MRTYDFYILLVLAAHAVFSAVCGSIAQKKGQSEPLYAIVGFLLGVIGLVIALVAPDRNEARAADGADAAVRGADAIAKYKGLLDSGAITQEEYDSMKARIMSGQGPATQPPADDATLRIALVCRRGRIRVMELLPRGGRRPYCVGGAYVEGSYAVGTDPKPSCRELAEEIERGSGRRVLWSAEVSD